mmetsp:Transcript_116011/g.247986  ORF Transcript_116011/g.247986 Transcript_116011/m.247986 type:complete len:270 (-) Transcript_116011:860-1669(-)
MYGPLVHSAGLDLHDPLHIVHLYSRDLPHDLLIDGRRFLPESLQDLHLGHLHVLFLNEGLGHLDDALVDLRFELWHMLLEKLSVRNRHLRYHIHSLHRRHLYLLFLEQNDGHLYDVLFRGDGDDFLYLPGLVGPLRLRHLSDLLHFQRPWHLYHPLLLHDHGHIHEALEVAKVVLRHLLVHVLHHRFGHLPDDLADLYLGHFNDALLVDDLRHLDHLLDVLEDGLGDLLLDVLDLNLGHLPDDLPDLDLWYLHYLLLNLDMRHLLDALH